MEEEEENNDLTINKFYVTPQNVLDWRKQYLKENHSVASTNTYYSFIKRYVGYGVEINQSSVNRFRNNNMQGVCAAALKVFFSYLVNKKDFPVEILVLRFDKSKSVKRFPKSIPYSEVEKLIEGMPTLKEKMKKQTFKLTEESIDKFIKKGCSNTFFINGGHESFREMLRELEMEIKKTK